MKDRQRVPMVGLAGAAAAVGGIGGEEEEEEDDLRTEWCLFPVEWMMVP